MVQGTRDNPPYRGNFIESLYEEQVSLLAKSKLTLLDYPFPDIFLRLSSFIHSISEGLAELKTWNFEITWLSARHELSRVGKPKCLYEKKFYSLPGLPYLPRRDNSPIRVSAPKTTQWGSYKWLEESFNILVKSLGSPRVTWREGCVGFPRPYKWDRRRQLRLKEKKVTLMYMYCLYSKINRWNTAQT